MSSFKGTLGSRSAKRRGDRSRLLCGVALWLGACAESQPQMTAITPLPPPAAAGAGAAPGQNPAAPGDGDIDRKQMPLPGQAAKISLPVPERMVLSNGTRVLVVERHTMPVVALAMVWPVGALEDPADRPGMAALAADMLDEGAGDKGPIELAEAFARLGARLSTRADFSSTSVTAMTLARNFDDTLRLFADVVKRPQIAPKELDRVKADTLTQIKQRNDNPANIAGDVFEEALYGVGHRRRAPAVGTAEAVKLLDHLDIRWWHRERLRPDDATLIVVGDVSAAALKGRLEAEFGAWKAPAKRKEAPVLPPAPPARRQVLAVDQPGKTQAVLAIGEPGVARNHPDYFPLLVMNSILGGQFNSRINMNLREKRGYAYGAYSEFAFGRDGGPFAVRASVKGNTARDSVQQVLEEVARMRQADVDPEELRQAKDLLVRSLARRFETVLQVAGELAAIEIYKLPDSYLATFAERVEAVASADVRRVAQQYLDPARMAIVLAGDRKDVEKLNDLPLGAPLTFRPAPAQKP